MLCQVGKLPSLQFYPGDWLRDPVSGCSLAAQGLWLRLMILMHDSERYGYLSQSGSPIPREQLARRCGCCSLAEFDLLFAELESAGIPSRTQDGMVYSRRMSRDAEERRKATARKAKERANGLSRRSHGSVTAASQKCHTASSASSSSSSSASFSEEEKQQQQQLSSPDDLLDRMKKAGIDETVATQLLADVSRETVQLRIEQWPRKQRMRGNIGVGLLIKSIREDFEISEPVPDSLARRLL